MLEYKREKATLESQLRDIQKRSVEHDDHLRIVDAWWTQVCKTFAALLYDVSNFCQLLDEITLLAKNVAPALVNVEGRV